MTRFHAPGRQSTVRLSLRYQCATCIFAQLRGVRTEITITTHYAHRIAPSRVTDKHSGSHPAPSDGFIEGNDNRRMMCYPVLPVSLSGNRTGRPECSSCFKPALHPSKHEPGASAYPVLSWTYNSFLEIGFYKLSNPGLAGKSLRFMQTNDDLVVPLVRVLVYYRGTRNALRADRGTTRKKRSAHQTAPTHVAGHRAYQVVRPIRRVHFGNGITGRVGSDSRCVTIKPV